MDDIEAKLDMVLVELQENQKALTDTMKAHAECLKALKGIGDRVCQIFFLVVCMMIAFSLHLSRG